MCVYGVGHAMGSASIATSKHVSLFVRGIGRACEASALQQQRVCLDLSAVSAMPGRRAVRFHFSVPVCGDDIVISEHMFVVLRSTSFVCGQTFDVLCL